MKREEFIDMMPAKTSTERAAIVCCDHCGVTWQYWQAQTHGWKAVKNAKPFSFRCNVCLPWPKVNQCDGCRRGLPIVDGLHKGEGYDMIACTKERY